MLTARMGDRRDIFGTRSPCHPMRRITDKRVLLGLRGAPGRIRTCDLRIRSPLLYPAELRGPRGAVGSRKVGAAGFEPATFRPQTERATRLRHAPTDGKYGGAARGTSNKRWRSACRAQGRGGPAGRGGHWGPCSLALATASWPCSRSWPSRLRRRRRPTRGPAARARAASERCASADAMPGQAAGEDLRDGDAVPDERRARGARARAPAGRAAAGPRRRRATRARWSRGRFFDHTSPGGSTMLARIKATSYLRDVTSWSVGENLAWGTGAAGHAARDGPRLDALGRVTAPTSWTATSPTSGIGVAAGAPVALEPGELGGTYVTDFGRRLRRLTARGALLGSRAADGRRPAPARPALRPGQGRLAGRRRRAALRRHRPRAARAGWPTARPTTSCASTCPRRVGGTPTRRPRGSSSAGSRRAPSCATTSPRCGRSPRTTPAPTAARSPATASSRACAWRTTAPGASARTSARTRAPRRTGSGSRARRRPTSPPSSASTTTPTGAAAAPC